MRYIIIPLLIILYIIWSYKSIKDMIKSYKNDTYHEEYTVFWIICHVITIFGYLIGVGLVSIINNW